MFESLEDNQVFQFIKEYKEVFILGGIGIVMALLGIGEWYRSRIPEQLELIELEEPQDEVTGDVVVDVSGAVNNPGVYRFSTGARWGEALEAAQGFSQDADQAWISQNLNLAAKLVDGGKVYVPAVGESQEVVVGSVATMDSSNLVSINRASQAQLEELKGIGETRAKAIITNRPYQTIDELSEKAKIPQSIIEDNKDVLVL